MVLGDRCQPARGVIRWDSRSCCGVTITGGSSRAPMSSNQASSSVVAGLLQRHYHPHDVFGLCISGKWHYLEHDWVAEAGSFIYESPGESHTLVVLESGEPMRTMFHVNGPLIWLDDDGNPSGIHDAFSLIEMTRAHYEAVGIGADYVDTLIR